MNSRKNKSDSYGSRDLCGGRSADDHWLIGLPVAHITRTAIELCRAVVNATIGSNTIHHTIYDYLGGDRGRGAGS